MPKGLRVRLPPSTLPDEAVEYVLADGFVCWICLRYEMKYPRVAVFVELNRNEAVRSALGLASMMELADLPVLETGAFGCAGSNPARRT